ncbi:MAG: hypothetical protein M3014_04050 [Chloroflexota bacterium]|nr:hypothetical protein [Chloroflexota bacterium]
MARFRGNAHASSDRAASTVLFLVLLIAVLLLAWYFADLHGFTTFWSDLSRQVSPRG